MIRDQATCQDCRTVEGAMQVDHILPCAKRGSADPWNLQVLCQACNREKGSRYGSREENRRMILVSAYATYLNEYLTHRQRQALTREPMYQAVARIKPEHWFDHILWEQTGMGHLPREPAQRLGLSPAQRAALVELRTRASITSTADLLDEVSRG